MESIKHDDKKAGGLKISVVNGCMLGMTCVLAVCLFFAALYTTHKYDQMIRGVHDYIRLEEQADTVHEVSDYLTNEVRLFVETTDVSHAELYFQEVNVARRREAAVAELSRQDVFSYDDVLEAVQASEELMKQEVYAMKLAAVARGHDMDALPAEIQEMPLRAEDAALEPAAMLEMARTLVFDKNYQQAKDQIQDRLEQFGLDVVSRTNLALQKGQEDLFRAVSIQRALLCVLVAVNALSTIAIVLLVVKPLRSYLDCIREQSMLKPSGAYEFQYLAQVYNEIYAKNKASAEKEALLKHKAEHDLMTGLQNRVSAEEQVRALMTDQENHGVLILLDLDDLKGINDTFGHKEGDRAILGIAETLKSHFRESDIIGRLGGDEFFVYLPGAAGNTDTISLSLTSLLRKLSGISIGADDERRIHCSIGCAVQTRFTNTFEALFKQADTALYHVKRSGKNHFAFYTAEMEQADYHFREQKLLTQQNAKKFESADLQELLNSLAAFYQLVLSVNLSANSYYLMEEIEDGVFSNVPAFGALDAFIRMAAKPVHPDDEAGFYDNLSRKSLMQAYQRGEKNVRHYFRFQHQDEYRWIEGNVIFYTNDQGDICDFTMLRWADERAHELERLWLQKVLDLAVVSSFEYICLLNLSTKEYFLHGDRENTHQVPEKGDFDEVTRMIRDQSIAPEERDAYYENAKISTIAARMQENGTYTYQYTMQGGVRQATFHWFEPTQTQVLMTVQRCS